LRAGEAHQPVGYAGYARRFEALVNQADKLRSWSKDTDAGIGDQHALSPPL